MGAPAPRGVVAGVDGSASSLSAVRWAAQDAALRHVPLTLVHVHAPGAEAGSADEVIDEAAAVAHDATATAASEIGARRACGEPVPELIAASREAQLVAVGSRGRTGHLRQRIGSVGVGLLQHAHCPVAVVHGDAPPRRGPGRKPVLVGVDGSKTSLKAAAFAFDEASRRGTGLLAMYVCKEADTPVTHKGLFAVLAQEAEGYLKKSLADLQRRYPEVVVHHLVRFEYPVPQLLVQAERAQLIVLGSHGRGAVSGKLLGSVSTSVAEQSRIPVIVVRRP